MYVYALNIGNKNVAFYKTKASLKKEKAKKKKKKKKKNKVFYFFMDILQRYLLQSHGIKYIISNWNIYNNYYQYQYI
jgi:hypothetical protein